MADGNHLKIADQVDLADDDPFAELTRIMGFDPRQPAKPAAPEKPASAQPSVQQAAVPEAPAPQKLFSRIATDSPPSLRTWAQVSPAMPPPTTATSTERSRSSGAP